MIHLSPPSSGFLCLCCVQASIHLQEKIQCIWQYGCIPVGMNSLPTKAPCSVLETSQVATMNEPNQNILRSTCLHVPAVGESVWLRGPNITSEVSSQVLRVNERDVASSLRYTLYSSPSKDALHFTVQYRCSMVPQLAYPGGVRDTHTFTAPLSRAQWLVGCPSIGINSLVLDLGHVHPCRRKQAQHIVQYGAMTQEPSSISPNRAESSKCTGSTHGE